MAGEPDCLNETEPYDHDSNAQQLAIQPAALSLPLAGYARNNTYDSVDAANYSTRKSIP